MILRDLKSSYNTYWLCLASFLLKNKKNRQFYFYFYHQKSEERKQVSLQNFGGDAIPQSPVSISTVQCSPRDFLTDSK